MITFAIVILFDMTHQSSNKMLLFCLHPVKSKPQLDRGFGQTIALAE
jgi:hypothetical protein